MAARYIVTGAAGFIGSHLAEALVEQGHEVLGVDCFTDNYDPALKEENAGALEVVRADLADAPLSDLLAGSDGVFHLAGQPGLPGFGDSFSHYLRRNVLASQRLFEAAASTRTRVVFASSSSVYGHAESFPTSEDVAPRPLSGYGVTKLASEQLARAYAASFGLDVVVLRYFTVYGPRQRPDMAFARIARALTEGKPFDIYGDGSQTRGFTYISDVVDATMRAMERAAAGSLYNVGAGSETSLADAIRLLEGASGRTLEVRRLEAVPGDMGRTAADTTRARDDLGWRPRISLEEGLNAQWDWSARVRAR